MSVDNPLHESIILCGQLEELLDNDYTELSKYLSGDLYDLYKEVIIKEKRILTESKELLIKCKNKI